MVSGREILPHQLPGATGGLSGSEIILPEQGSPDSPSLDGQLISHRLRQPHWGNEVTVHVQSGDRFMGVVPGEKNISDCIPSPRGREYDRRQPLEVSCGPPRLDPEPQCVQATQLSLGSIGGGLVCNKDLETTDEIFRKPDPHAEAIDAFTQVWLGLRYFANSPWSLIGR